MKVGKNEKKDHLSFSFTYIRRCRMKIEEWKEVEEEGKKRNKRKKRENLKIMNDSRMEENKKN